MANDPHELPAIHRLLRRWHERARSVGVLHWLVIVTRIGLALAFVPQGLLKLRGVPFTTVSTTTRVGYFFDAMYRSGEFWRFIGASQLIVSLLLLLPATSTLGALLFLPIILNIFVLVVALQYPLLPMVTGGMLLLVTLLIAWDYDRLASVIWGAPAAYTVPPAPPPARRYVARVRSRLQRLHTKARTHAALHRLAVISRILLALAFMPTAMVKMLGLRFTSISPSTPIGHFFEAMYQSGIYWRFLGLSQLVAGALLLIPATSTVGAVLFFPIALSIFVITVSLHFTGTPVITGLMLLAATFLLCWDYHRLAALLWGAPAVYDVERAPSFPLVERVGYVVGGVGAMAVLFLARGLGTTGAMRAMAIGGILLALIGAALVVTGWVQATRPVRQAT
ncbi:MAG: hypothetical protein V4813_00330 [Gemmatimonadota bacterium]